MKKNFFLAVVLTLITVGTAFAQNWEFIDAQDLTICGKVFEDTPCPYHRLDLEKYAIPNATEQTQSRLSAGIAISFRSDSPDLSVLVEFGDSQNASTTAGLSLKGFDLYRHDSGKWMWAGCAIGVEGTARKLISSVAPGMHEYLLYLPLFTEVKSLKIGALEGHSVEAAPNPFRHRIAVFGSSYTHGSSTSRPGMTYCAQMSRTTGLQMINFGYAGHCLMQDYFAEVLADADVDAFVFDAFSNPSSQVIEERLFDFIETIQASNPGKPLIFQKTIYREARNFNTELEKREAGKWETAQRMMEEACRKYKDVYYVTTTCSTDKEHTTSVDGTHPGDYGYSLWAKSIEKPVKKILARYGIR